jgi:hypothetical protein
MASGPRPKRPDGKRAKPTLTELINELLQADRLDPLPLAAHAVQERLELARTNWEGALDVASTRPADYDFHFQTMYTGLLDSAGALVRALGYRVKGAEESHMMLFGLAATALEAAHPVPAGKLISISDHARRLRRRAVYDRSGTIGKIDRDFFFGEASVIMQAIELFACRQAGLPIPGHDWEVQSDASRPTGS